MDTLKDKQNLICRRCHRKLKDNISIKLGFGPVCYQKYLQKQTNYLFEMEAYDETIKQKRL